MYSKEFPYNKILFVYFVLSFLKINAFGQYQNKVWCFGDSALIDFTSGTPVTGTSYMDCFTSSCSIGDVDRPLIFYANSLYFDSWITGSSYNTVIRNSSNLIINNGDSINAFGGRNSLVFIPKPNNDSLIYLFHTAIVNGNPNPGLFYTTINQKFNFFQGKVISKNNLLPCNNNFFQEGIVAIKHGNGRDWWIIVRNWRVGVNNNTFNKFLVTPHSISGPYYQSIGQPSGTDLTNLFCSQDGSKLINVAFGQVEEFDFDRCSGTISSARLLVYQNVLSFWGACLSPNNRFLYLASISTIYPDSVFLYQLDLLNANPYAAKVTLYADYINASLGLMKLAPDGKIYMGAMDGCGWRYLDSCRTIYNENLSVINYPDSFGSACQFAPFSFYLGGRRTYWPLPNNPNYELGPLSNSTCDSLFSSIPDVRKSEVLIYPNPAKDFVNLEFSHYKKRTLIIYNSLGQEMDRIDLQETSININVQFYPPGVYYVCDDESKAILIREN